MDDANLIEWFPKSNTFIEEGLKFAQQASHECNRDQIRDVDTAVNNGVLVHCAMGKSRSATVIVAYLLWDSHRRPFSIPSAPFPLSASSASGPPQSRDAEPADHKALTPETALDVVRRGRPLVEPNHGFMDQLNLYHSMGCPSSVDDQPKYQRWLYQMMLQHNLRAHRAPDVADVHFEDEHDEAQSTESGMAGVSSVCEAEVKCRRCRHLLAKSGFLVDHKPAATIQQGGGNQIGEQPEAKDCAHLFLHPLSWMRACLGDGKLDGRLTCPNPKCGANVGKFAWQGMRCSCGEWVTPGFGLVRGKVDEVTAVPCRPGQASAAGASLARVRLPPGMRGREYTAYEVDGNGT